MHPDFCQKLWGTAYCKNAPRWFPVLVLLNERAERIATCMVNLKICDVHRRILAPTDFITDDGWERIVLNLDRAQAGFPIRDKTTFTFEAIT